MISFSKFGVVKRIVIHLSLVQLSSASLVRFDSVSEVEKILNNFLAKKKKILSHIAGECDAKRSM